MMANAPTRRPFVVSALPCALCPLRHALYPPRPSPLPSSVPPAPLPPAPCLLPSALYARYYPAFSFIPLHTLKRNYSFNMFIVGFQPWISVDAYILPRVRKNVVHVELHTDAPFH